MIAVPRAASAPHAVPRRSRGTAFAFAALLALACGGANAAHRPYGEPVARNDSLLHSLGASGRPSGRSTTRW